MSKSSHSTRGTSPVKAAEAFTGNQGDLFQQLAQPPVPADDLDVHFDLLAAITHALRDARSRGLSRERVVDRMNRYLPELDKPLTLRQLNAWTASSQEYKEFPARFLPALCAATECDLPLRVLAQPLCRELVDARDMAYKRLGEVRMAGAALKREERDLVQRIGA